jgi:hypothetical protein
MVKAMDGSGAVNSATGRKPLLGPIAFRPMVAHSVDFRIIDFVRKIMRVMINVTKT